MFIATAVRLLADEGKLSRYLEGLPISWQGYRVRHLLGMSTGLPEDWDVVTGRFSEALAIAVQPPPPRIPKSEVPKASSAR